MKKLFASYYFISPSLSLSLSFFSKIISIALLIVLYYHRVKIKSRLCKDTYGYSLSFIDKELSRES